MKNPYSINSDKTDMEILKIIIKIRIISTECEIPEWLEYRSIFSEFNNEINQLSGAITLNLLVGL